MARTSSARQRCYQPRVKQRQEKKGTEVVKARRAHGATAAVGADAFSAVEGAVRVFR